ncbi:MAG: hypothetical protein AAAB35_11710 [Phyllobacterium sp.]|uniref:hypothetical protein n=1 Tax=Phyllobacterium sp. TaxID=1871046 RepID=UPI0030F0EF6A
MQIFLISLQRDARAIYSADDLTHMVESLPGSVEILDGHNKDVLTVKMDMLACDAAATRIPFARVEDYYEMNLL